MANALDHRVLVLPSTTADAGNEAFSTEDAVAGWFRAASVCCTTRAARGGQDASHQAGVQPASKTPRNNAASALTPASAPKTARPAVLRARACKAAAIPETPTATSLTISVAR